MNCWHCKTELIWGGDSSCDHLKDFDFVASLSCPQCKSEVEVYHPRSKQKP